MFADVNECEASPRACHPNANCTNTGGSYECNCSVGFTGDGMSCSGRNCLHWYTESIDSPLFIDLDECQSGTHICDSDSDCVNTIGNYSCICPVELQWNGESCQGIDI